MKSENKKSATVKPLNKKKNDKEIEPEIEYISFII